MTHGFVLSRYNFCVNINDILVLELKWFSHAHPRWSLDSSFLPANPRKPSAVIILFTDNCLFSISTKPSWAALIPTHLGEALWEDLKPSKSLHRGPQLPLCPASFPEWLQHQGHHDGKTGDEERREASRTSGSPLCVGGTSHCPTQGSQGGLCKQKWKRVYPGLRANIDLRSFFCK